MNKVNNIYSEKMGRHLLRKGISLGAFMDPFTQVQDRTGPSDHDRTCTKRVNDRTTKCKVYTVV